MVKRCFTKGFIPGILSWTVLVILFSCENPLLFNRCPDCYHTEPLNAEIIAKITYSSSGMPTTIRVYEGNPDDGILLSTYRGRYSQLKFSVKLNKLYTVTATYNNSGKSYIAVDSASPGVRNEQVLCDQPCFLIYDNEIDLRIKGL